MLGTSISFFQCEICSQHIKEGSRTVHVLRCKRREQLKTIRCLLCNKNFAFDSILYHLKNTHNAWEHIKISTKPAARSPKPMIYEDKGLQVENGRVAPPPTPEQEVPEEIEKIVQELRNLDQATEKIKEQRTENPGTAEQLMDEISSEDLIKFDNFDFNLLLL